MAYSFALLNALKFLGGMLGSKSKACAQAKMSTVLKLTMILLPYKVSHTRTTLNQTNHYKRS
jgi:hypothetical protein